MSRRTKGGNKAWRDKKADRMAARANRGVQPQPRDELGFIIVKLPDGTTGRKYDTKRAHEAARFDKQVSAEVDKAAAERKAKNASKMRAMEKSKSNKKESASA